MKEKEIKEELELGLRCFLESWERSLLGVVKELIQKILILIKTRLEIGYLIGKLP